MYMCIIRQSHNNYDHELTASGWKNKNPAVGVGD